MTETGGIFGEFLLVGFLQILFILPMGEMSEKGSNFPFHLGRWWETQCQIQPQSEYLNCFYQNTKPTLLQSHGNIGYCGVMIPKLRMRFKGVWTLGEHSQDEQSKDSIMEAYSFAQWRELPGSVMMNRKNIGSIEFMTACTPFLDPNMQKAKDEYAVYIFTQFEYLCIESNPGSG